MSFLRTTRAILKALDEDEAVAVGAIVRASRRVFTVGNGGGAAHASHLANDLRKIAHIESYCVNDNAAEISARENDDGWEHAYKGYLKASHIGPRDCLFVFSVGGGGPDVSANLCHAIDYAKRRKTRVVGLVGGGRGGGYLRVKATASVLIPSDSTPQVEGIQSVLAHMIACS